MRSRDVSIPIRDAIDAGEVIIAFLGDTTFEAYSASEILTSAVERKFEVLGEALARAVRIEPGVAEAVPEARRIIGLRNVLVHGYDIVDPKTIYLIATSEVSELAATLRRLSGMEGAE